MSSLKLKAVLFDLDGTLYIERPFLIQGFAAAARKAARDFKLGAAAEVRLRREMLRLYDKGDRVRIFNRVLEPALPELPAKTVDAYIERTLVPFFRSTPRRLKLIPAAARLLKTLRRKKIKLGLVTQGHRLSQTAKLKALGLTRAFGAIEISGHYPPAKAKPSPFMFRKALRRLRVSAKDAVFVGDNPKTDFGAVRAGLRLYLLGGARPAHPLITPIRSITDIEKLIP